MLRIRTYIIKCFYKFIPCRDKILGLLNTNRRASNDLVAEVLDQSADNLIDGVTSGALTKWVGEMQQ